MTISSWPSWPLSHSHARRGQRHNHASRPKKARFSLEPLEGRALLTSYYASNVSELIADVNPATLNNTITLTAPPTAPYVLTAVNNTWNGANGLPLVEENLTIIGNGDTIERSTAAGTPAFRLFAVSAGYTLTLQDLTLQGGLAFGSDGVPAEGGAIYNQGYLALTGVAVENNEALGAPGLPGVSGEAGGAGGNALGGGLYQGGGTVSLTDTTLSSNTAQGGNGVNFSSTLNDFPSAGGEAAGGAYYAAGGTVALMTDNVASNTALGGQGGQGGPTTPGHPAWEGVAGSGGPAYGGVLCDHGDTYVTVANSTLSNNIAQGGAGGAGDLASGTAGAGGSGYGGVIVVTGAVSLEGDILFSNTAQGGAGGEGYHGASGGGGFGGAIYAPGGNIANYFTSLTLSSNTARGGAAGVNLHPLAQVVGGEGFGGAIYYFGPLQLTLLSDTISSNVAQGGAGANVGYDGLGEGGGLYIGSAYNFPSDVWLDAFTVANTIDNIASRSYPNIFGTYTVVT